MATLRELKQNDANAANAAKAANAANAANAAKAAKAAAAAALAKAQASRAGGAQGQHAGVGDPRCAPPPEKAILGCIKRAINAATSNVGCVATEVARDESTVCKHVLATAGHETMEHVEEDGDGFMPAVLFLRALRRTLDGKDGAPCPLQVCLKGGGTATPSTACSLPTYRGDPPGGRRALVLGTLPRVQTNHELQWSTEDSFADSPADVRRALGVLAGFFVGLALEAAAPFVRPGLAASACAHLLEYGALITATSEPAKVGCETTVRYIDKSRDVLITTCSARELSPQLFEQEPPSPGTEPAVHARSLREAMTQRESRARWLIRVSVRLPPALQGALSLPCFSVGQATPAEEVRGTCATLGVRPGSTVAAVYCNGVFVASAELAGVTIHVYGRGAHEWATERVEEELGRIEQAAATLERDSDLRAVALLLRALRLRSSRENAPGELAGLIARMCTALATPENVRSAWGDAGAPWPAWGDTAREEDLTFELRRRDPLYLELEVRVDKKAFLELWELGDSELGVLGGRVLGPNAIALHRTLYLSEPLPLDHIDHVARTAVG